VEVDPIDAEVIAPDTSTIDELDLTRARRLDTSSQRKRPQLRLTFNSQPAIEVSENVAIGRNPSSVGGRRPIRVTSAERMLSRTHALIDADEEGRILITDYGSGNGIEVQTSPPQTLEPYLPYALPSGITILMGDVTCRIYMV
jgi:pSer/pThr/pTyr-binding forkhead associated (FHA) protein